MKCIGKPVTTWTIPRSITLSPLHLMLFRGKSNTFGTVYSIVYRNGDWYGACLSISMKIYWSGRCCRSRSCCCSSGSSHSKQCGSGYCSLLLFFYFFGECTVQVRNKKNHNFNDFRIWIRQNSVNLDQFRIRCNVEYFILNAVIIDLWPVADDLCCFVRWCSCTVRQFNRYAILLSSMWLYFRQFPSLWLNFTSHTALRH